MTLNIPDFSSLRILVAGDAMLDEYCFGDTGRISSEAPVPVVKTNRSEQRPGGAANVANNIAALGSSTHLAAVVGTDIHGQELAELLAASNVECHFLQISDAPTIHKLRVLSRSQQLIRLDSEEVFHGHEEAFAKLFAGLLADKNVVVLSDYAKGSLSQVEQLIALSNAAAVPVLVDPKGTEFYRYKGATVLTPNEVEFASVVGSWGTEDKFLSLGEALQDDLDLEALLVTRGEKGLTLFARGEQAVSFPAEAHEVFDVTGAGDTVIGLMAAGIGCGLNLEEAAALANLGAGLVVRKIGVASVSTSEIRMALHRKGTGGWGLVSANELKPLVKEAQACGERVVMTNGCFDILHAGHVSYLEEAKVLGDRLIVAVNDDDSVTRLKGNSRPINSLADRMTVLAGLAAVDWVVAFSADTPAELVSRLLPDILVKGGDYQADEIVGGKAVIQNGGEVQILSLKEGLSTSAMIKLIRKT